MGCMTPAILEYPKQGEIEVAMQPLHPEGSQGGGGVGLDNFICNVNKILNIWSVVKWCF